MQHARRHAVPMVSLVALLTVGASGCSSTGEIGSVDEIRGAVESVLGSGEGSGALSTSDIATGLKEALRVGTSSVVGKLGQPGGYSEDKIAFIPLPDALSDVRDVAERFGLGGQLNELEMKLNEAAEEATPKAKALFLGAIRDMSLADARGILQGPDDAATQYFRKSTGDKLSAEMRPIIDDALSEVGAVSTFNRLAGRLSSIPGLGSIDTDLTGYVVDEASDGIFHYVAEEEKAIRENPLKRSSEILQRVFSSTSNNS